MTSKQDSWSSGLAKTCNYCGKNVTRKVKCTKCDAVFHNSCSQRKVCCENQLLITEKNADEDSAVSPNPTTAEFSNMDFNNLKFENEMLKRLLYEMESKCKILEQSNSLLMENKMLLEEKLYLAQKNMEQRTTRVPPTRTQPNKSELKSTSATINSLNKRTSTSAPNQQDTQITTKEQNSNTQKIEEAQRKKLNHIINLTKVPDEEDEFKTVTYKRRNTKRFEKLYGENQEMEGQNDFAAEKKVWLYLYRIKRHICENDIEVFIKKQEQFKNANVVIKELPTNENQTKCFMFGIDWTHKSEIYKPTAWPKSVAYKRFNFRKYKSYQNNHAEDFA